MERFWSKVQKSDTCWLWTARVGTNGYGQFKLDGKTVPAHRVSLTLMGVELTRSDVVMHACDTPLCVNPSHLSVGTHKENSDDKWAKGRGHTVSECPHGHVYDEVNTYLYNGKKHCRKCRNERTKRWRRTSS